MATRGWCYFPGLLPPAGLEFQKGAHGDSCKNPCKKRPLLVGTPQC